MPELVEAAKRTNAWACYDCGKCTATCPISRVGGDYSPRRHVLATNLRQRQSIIHNGTLSICLTCGMCDQRCPAEVGYTELVKSLRELSYREGVEPECPHGGALQSTMRMMAKGGTQQNRMEWLRSATSSVAKSSRNVPVEIFLSVASRVRGNAREHSARSSADREARFTDSRENNWWRRISVR